MTQRLFFGICLPGHVPIWKINFLLLEEEIKNFVGKVAMHRSQGSLGNSTDNNLSNSVTHLI